MKLKLILFSLVFCFCSCNKNLYKIYSFKQKDVRDFNFNFINDTLGSFDVKYLCSDTLKKIEQKFTYKKISDGIFSVKGILNKKKYEPFIYVSVEDLKNCVETKESISIKKIPVIMDEEIVIYKKKLFWQKIDNGVVVSSLLFTAEKGKMKN